MCMIYLLPGSDHACTWTYQSRANGNCEYPQASTGLKCAEKMRQLKALLGGVPLAMHWYGWNAEPFDSKYPHYTVLPGVEKEVASLQAAGVHGKSMAQQQAPYHHHLSTAAP